MSNDGAPRLVGSEWERGQREGIVVRFFSKWQSSSEHVQMQTQLQMMSGHEMCLLTFQVHNMFFSLTETRQNQHLFDVSVFYHSHGQHCHCFCTAVMCKLCLDLCGVSMQFIVNTQLSFLPLSLLRSLTERKL